jgi:hypothetical protein
MSTQTYHNEFFLAYVETALWSTSIGEDFAAQWQERYNECFTADTSMTSFGFTIEDLDSSAYLTMEEDCRSFVTDNEEIMHNLDAGQAGHDFWLTRNRHGAGFWDGDYDESVATCLTDAAHVYGSQELYVTNDERIYIS